jgi:hypothetical protein
VQFDAVNGNCKRQSELCVSFVYFVVKFNHKVHVAW